MTTFAAAERARLADLLLEKGYEVHGLLRRSASADVINERLRWLGVADRVKLVDGNLTDLPSLLARLAIEPVAAIVLRSA